MLAYLILSGITTGALYALIALGITILYKAAGTVNFAALSSNPLFLSMIRWHQGLEDGVPL